MKDLKSYSLEELSLRNGIKMKENWIAYKGFIYDVTHSPLFKNGKHYRHLTGSDLTEFMSEAPHTDDVMKDLEVVGRLG